MEGIRHGMQHPAFVCYKVVGVARVRAHPQAPSEASSGPPTACFKPEGKTGGSGLAWPVRAGKKFFHLGFHHSY